MQNINIIRNKKFLIVGLARSGLATAEFLAKHDAEVIVWDDHEDKRRAAQSLGHVVCQPDRIDWTSLHALCLSPGVPLDYPQTHPFVGLARKHKCPIINDIMLMGLLHPQNLMIGVTGTNGKSTTTALIGHLLSELGFRVAVGGNIGVACLSLPDLGPEGIYVLEVSSFQLELVSRSPFTTAVLLNFSADHLDRHGNMENYIQAKMNIFERDSQFRVVGVDDQYCQNIARSFLTKSATSQNLTRISGHQKLENGVFVHNEFLIVKDSEHEHEIGAVTALRALKGTHNHQNAAAAVAACLSVYHQLDLAPPSAEAIMGALGNFHSLPHRQQLVADWKNITFINDSKATNWDAAQNSLGAFENILWIAGGRPKDSHFSFDKKSLKNVRKAFLIGEAAELLKQGLDSLKESEIAFTMETALRMAVSYAQANPEQHFHILLAPACTSFDQYQDYEDRGRAFETLTHEITK